MEYRTVRLKVEAFDVEDAAVAGLHDDGNLPVARRFANEELHVERITLFDHEVESIQELAQVLGADPRRLDDHTKIGVDLSDASRGDDGFVDTEVQDTRGDPVQVRKFQSVEVGQSDLSGQTFHGDHVGNGVPGTQAHHTDAQRPLPCLFGT